MSQTNQLQRKQIHDTSHNSYRFRKTPQKLSLSSRSLLRLWSWSNQMPNASSVLPPIAQPVCNAVFQSIKHKHVTVYMPRLLSPLHCIISWADVSPLYKTPGVCIIYCSGLAKSSSSTLTELWAGLAHHPSELWGWGRGRAPVQRWKPHSKRRAS